MSNLTSIFFQIGWNQPPTRLSFCFHPKMRRRCDTLQHLHGPIPCNATKYRKSGKTSNVENAYICALFGAFPPFVPGSRNDLVVEFFKASRKTWGSRQGNKLLFQDVSGAEFNSVRCDKGARLARLLETYRFFLVFVSGKKHPKQKSKRWIVGGRCCFHSRDQEVNLSCFVLLEKNTHHFFSFKRFGVDPWINWTGIKKSDPDPSDGWFLDRDQWMKVNMPVCPMDP